MAAGLSGQSWAILAASEMGKGVWLKGWLRKAKPARLLIWDRNDEYSEHAKAVGSLVELLQATRGNRYAVRLVTDKLQGRELRATFEGFCAVVLRSPGACVIVEELADVTTAAHAPPQWGQVNTRGRHHLGLHVIGLSQSPAWIDKRFLANATMLHVGYLGTLAHRRAVADEIDIPEAEIKALPQFAFVQYDRKARKLTRGTVKPPAKRP